MAGRQHAVEAVVADEVQLPAHRVVQGVHAGVAPVAVQVVGRAGGGRAGQLEQLSLAASAMRVVSTLASATATEARPLDSAVTGAAAASSRV
jgi:hypothetical protein